MFFHKTEFRDFEWKEFLSPFSKELWIAAVTVTFAMSICLTVIHAFNSHEEFRQQFNFFRNVHDVFSILCQQGTTLRKQMSLLTSCTKFLFLMQCSYVLEPYILTTLRDFLKLLYSVYGKSSSINWQTIYIYIYI